MQQYECSERERERERYLHNTMEIVAECETPLERTDQ